LNKHGNSYFSYVALVRDDPGFENVVEYIAQKNYASGAAVGIGIANAMDSPEHRQLVISDVAAKGGRWLEYSKAAVERVENDFANAELNDEDGQFYNQLVTSDVSAADGRNDAGTVRAPNLYNRLNFFKYPYSKDFTFWAIARTTSYFDVRERNNGWTPPLNVIFEAYLGSGTMLSDFHSSRPVFQGMRFSGFAEYYDEGTKRFVAGVGGLLYDSVGAVNSITAQSVPRDPINTDYRLFVFRQRQTVAGGSEFDARIMNSNGTVNGFHTRTSPNPPIQPSVTHPDMRLHFEVSQRLLSCFGEHGYSNRWIDISELMQTANPYLTLRNSESP
jgi:hypothetical protein